MNLHFIVIAIVIFNINLNSANKQTTYNKLINSGQGYLKNEKPNKAIKEFSKAIKLEPNNIIAYRLIAMIYVFTSDSNSALELYKKILNRKFIANHEKGKSKVCENMGDIYLRRNEYKNAEIFYKKGLEYNSNRSILNGKLVILELHRNKYYESLKFINTSYIYGNKK